MLILNSIISSYEVSHVGVVNALMAFSIKLNLAMNSELSAALSPVPPVKSLIVVKATTVLPTA